MIGDFRSVLVTPNIDGADGVSCLSRQIAAALPEPVMVLSLHDRTARAPLRRSAGGSRIRFVADAGRLAPACDSATIVVASHVHLAPIARALAWRGASLTTVLCGIEAWVPMRAAERWALSRGRLVAISAHTARGFRAANPSFAEAAIDVFHPGLPAAGGAPEGTPTEEAALIVGRMAAGEAYKGHEELLRVWPRVLARRPRARLWIAGDGDDRQRLERLAASLRIADAITFYGRVPDAELESLYQRCRFFVMPSRREGFGLVFLEAMRLGKACIGGPGAAEEIIRHGATGLIVDAAKADDLAEAMLMLFDDPALADAMGRAGEARFRAEFTDARFAARFAARARIALPGVAALKRPVS